MVLDLDYDDTPDPDAEQPGEGTGNDPFWAEWLAWAEKQGATFWFYYDEHPIHLDRWIACVNSINQPGKDHVVVMRRTGLFHDPSRQQKLEHINPGSVKYGIAFE